MNEIGDNSGNQLRSYIERIEREEEARRDIAEGIKEIYQELKSSGFDAKAVRKIVALRRMDKDKRAEEEAILETYMASLGMLADLPLGQAAIDRVRG
tara:strand:- start:1898 stop:2188 length:291 start_codon:yes stop_codon:yes gene_type:complete